MTQSLLSQVKLQQFRAPSAFRGEVYEYVENRLEQLECVAHFNQGTSEQKLRNVYFSLEGIAMTRFENRKGNLPTRDDLREKEEDTFS